VRPIRARRGATWPSSPGIDHLLIEGLIERFGGDGAKLRESDDHAVFDVEAGQSNPS
jgi:hypothetical protein